MDRFIEFAEAVSMEELKEVIDANDPGVLILRFSKLTGTVKVRFHDSVSKREIKKAFLPYKVKKIYTDFPLGKAPVTA